MDGAIKEPAEALREMGTEIDGMEASSTILVWRLALQ